MGTTRTGTRGELVVIPSGTSPTFAADMDAIATDAMANGFRPFTTVAAMVASTGSGIGEWARCANAVGADYYTDGTRWYLGNQPQVANSSARDALFSGTCQPVQGNEVFRQDLGIWQVFYALFNGGTNPGGATPAAWYPSPGTDMWVHMDRGANQSVANNTLAAALGDTFGLFATPRAFPQLGLVGNIYSNPFFAWDRSAGTLTPRVAGVFDIAAAVQWPTNTAGGTDAIAITKNSTAAFPDAGTLDYDIRAYSAAVKPMTKVMAKNVPLQTTDVIRLMLQNVANGAAVNAGGDGFAGAAYFDIRYIGPIHA